MEADQVETRRRWMDVGQAEEADGRTAGAKAAARAMTGADPRLVMAYVSPQLRGEDVLAGIRDVVPADVPLIGCSTHGEIYPGGPADGAVVVVALGGTGFTVNAVAARDVAGRQRQAGAEIAAAVTDDPERPHRVLVTLTDGFLRDQEEILRGAYGVLGAAVPLFGGAAADGWQMTGSSFQLFGSEVLSGAVVAAAIMSEAPIGMGIRHGWQPLGEPMVVTDAGNGRVYQLDDRPALDAYLDRLGADPSVYADRDAFTEFALSRPVGVQRRSGVELRNLSTEPDVEGRSIGGGGAIAEGGLIWAMDGGVSSILEASGAACEDALAGLDGRPPVGVLTFSCAALRAVLGDDGIRQEGAVFSDVLEGVPFGGFYTYGEIARIAGIEGFHNQTVVALALA